MKGVNNQTRMRAFFTGSTAKIGLLTLAVAAWLIMATGVSFAQSPAELAVRVQARYQTIQAISADYERSSEFVATGGLNQRKVQGSGRLIWARPDRLRLEQDQPRPELIVAGTEGVWWVRPKRKRADLYPLKQFTTGLRPLLDVLGGLARLDQSFKLAQPTAAEKEAAGQSLPLVLTPITTRADLKRLLVWFDSDQLNLKGFRLTSLVGDVTQYRLVNLKINPSLAKDAFSYSPPQGFRVKDHLGR